MTLLCKRGFSDEGRILIENLYIFKVLERKKLLKEFPNKSGGLRGLNELLKKLREKLVRRQDEAGSVRPRNA